ncbi:hypothetical protein [Chitinophaga sp. GbtcB8]|uniref:hypothetical protein n=1 Tax=Chitinophaga sp. GbtcB8 TaxID=2824753 RepID=UPI001C30C231|nr:hypothetical protein [Chitinophaga sp. GbtcB8]
MKSIARPQRYYPKDNIRIWTKNEFKISLEESKKPNWGDLLCLATYKREYLLELVRQHPDYSL